MSATFDQAAAPTEDGICLPDSLSHIEITRELASNATQSHFRLFEAKDQRLQRDVLVKCVSYNAEQADAVLAEARAIAALKHFSFRQIHNIDTENGRLFIVCESIQGQTIAEWTTSFCGQEKYVLRHIEDLACALEEARNAGIANGDLRAEHLLIDPSGRLRILHFGFDRLVQHEGPSHSNKSLFANDNLEEHIHFFAPERFNQNQASVSSEVFAVGVLAYYMLLGHYPHHALNGLALFAAQVQTDSSQWECPPSMLRSVIELVQAMTCRDVSSRCTLRQVMTRCNEIRERELSSTTSPSIHILALREDLRKQDRRRARWIGAGLTVLCITVTAVTWHYQSYWPQVFTSLRPFSETQELEQGVKLLEEFAQLPLPNYLDEASEHFNKILQRSPQHAEAVAAMAIVYLQRYQSGQRDEIWIQKASASTQQALLLNPKHSIAQVAHARLLQWQHKLPEALDAAETSIELEPDGILAWHTKMSILLEMGQQEQAITFAEEGARKFPKDRFLLDLLGGIYLARGEFKQLEDALQRSLKRRPEGRLAYSLMATGLMQQGRDSEALQYIQRGLEVFPSPNLYGSLGDIRMAQGHYDEAADAYEKAASPQSGVTGSYLRWISYAESLVWTSNRQDDSKPAFEKARSLLELRLKRAPDDPVLKLHLAHILSRLGESQAARELLPTIRIETLRSDSTFMQLALVYELLGDREQALQQFRRMKQLQLPIDDRHPVFKALKKDPRYLQLGI